MSTMNKPIAGTFGFTDFIVGVVTRDLNRDQANYRSRGGKGSSIAWILGHLMHYRHLAVATLGDHGENPYQAFGEVGASNGSDYPPLDTMTKDWQAMAERLHGVLAGVSDEALMAGAQGVHGERSVLDQISFLQWHEAYHMGVLGAIRTELGLPATSELVDALQAT